MVGLGCTVSGTALVLNVGFGLTLRRGFRVVKPCELVEIGTFHRILLKLRRWTRSPDTDISGKRCTVKGAGRGLGGFKRSITSSRLNSYNPIEKTKSSL